MSTLDYILGLAALALILFNMRRHELTDRRLRRPLIIAAVTCAAFLPGIPTAGNDAVLVAACIAIGAACSWPPPTSWCAWRSSGGAGRPAAVGEMVARLQTA